MAKNSLALPKSVTPAGVAWASTVSFLALLSFLYRYNPFDDIVVSACFILGLMACVTLSTDFFAYRGHLRETTGMDYSRRDVSISRTITKLVGLVASVFSIAVLYKIFPFFSNDLSQFFMSVARNLIIPVAILAVPYVFFVDMYQKNPRDGYWNFGNIFCFRWSNVNVTTVRDHFRGWIIKGFFLPIMFGFFCYSLQEILSLNNFSEYKFPEIYSFLFKLAFLFDLSIASLGYATTFRPLDTHIRSTDPTAFGWIVAIMCYVPFWPFVSQNFLKYDNNLQWGEWLWDRPILYGIWGTLILTCLFFYVYAVAQYGCRFSNLTHRGVITSGPYKWTKHPSYLFKNFSWWLIAIPFIPGSGSFVDALTNCILLVFVNIIYYLRAKTEERHLCRDSEYVKYAMWINENGIIAHCRIYVMKLIVLSRMIT